MEYRIASVFPPRHAARLGVGSFELYLPNEKRQQQQAIAFAICLLDRRLSKLDQDEVDASLSKMRTFQLMSSRSS